MIYHILAVGDVVGEQGVKHLERHLRPLKKLKKIDFTVVNGENASGVGLTEEQAQDAAAAFESVCSDAEVTVLNGGQPVYYYMISAE